MRLKIMEKAFKIEDKLQKFKAFLASKAIDNLAEKCIVIVLPLFNQDFKLIEDDDPKLFAKQNRDAELIADFVKNFAQGTVHLVLRETGEHRDSQLVWLAKQALDYIIFLHEFPSFEQDYFLHLIDKFESIDNQQIEMIDL